MSDFVGSGSDGDDGFVVDFGEPVRKRGRPDNRVGAGAVPFAVAAATPSSGRSVVWWGALTLRWQVAASIGPENREAHERANRQTTQPGGAFVDYVVVRAEWLPSVVAGPGDVVPPQALWLGMDKSVKSVT